MIGISTLDGKWLDLGSKVEITINAECPVFDRDSIDRVWTFPFDLPATPHNVAILNHINRLDATTRTNRTDVVIYLSGTPFQYGVIEVVRTKKQQISCVFKNNSLRLAQKLASLPLRSINHVVEVAEPYNPQILFATIWIPGQKTSMAIGINEHVFQADVIDLPGLMAQINAVWPGIVSDPGFPHPPNEQVFLLQNFPDPNNFHIYLKPVVETPATTTFFYILESSAQMDTQRIDEAYDELLQAGGNDTIRFPIIKAPNIYGDKNSLYSGYVNYITPSGDHPNDPSVSLDDLYAWPHTLLPLPYLSKVMEAALLALGIPGGLSGNFFADDEIQNLLFWHNTPIDLVVGTFDFVVDREATWINDYRHTYKPSFNAAELYPDVSCLDLFVRIGNTFCLVISEKQGGIVITPVRDLLRSAPEDWTTIAEPYQQADLPSFAPVSLDYDRQGDDYSDGAQLLRVEGGKDAEEFKVAAYTLFEKLESDEFLIKSEAAERRSWRVPYTIEEGTCTYLNLSKASSFRVLFWRGIQKDGSGNDYPLATHGRRAFEQEVGAYSLDWNGDGGLYKTWWEDYILMVTRGRVVSRRVQLNVAQLSALLQWTSIKKTIMDSSGTSTAVVKSVKVKITPAGISMADVVMVTV